METTKGLVADPCVAFDAMDIDSLIRLIEKHEREIHVQTWALYVVRGQKSMVTIRDGLRADRRFMYAGPKAPYRGFLFLRHGTAIEDERERSLRCEVGAVGNHNIVARRARRSEASQAVRSAIME